MLLGLRALTRQVENESSTLQDVTGLIGTLVSGVFLTIIGLINLMVLLGIVKVFRGMRRGRYDERRARARSPEAPSTCRSGREPRVDADRALESW
jgi:high-affinity nickel-transport protein